DGLVLARGPELLLRLVERIVVGDPGRRLHHLGERPVRDAFAVRQAAPTEDGGALQARDELARQPALPDTRLAVDREQRGAAVARRTRERVLEQLELGLAADERRGEARERTAALAGAEHAVGEHRLVPPPELERAHLLEVDEPVREPAGTGADEDLARGRPL